MPVYRVHHADQPAEVNEADSARREGIHTTLRGTVLVMGRPREIVLRRVAAAVLVEELPPSAALPDEDDLDAPADPVDRAQAPPVCPGHDQSSRDVPGPREQQRPPANRPGPASSAHRAPMPG